MQNQRVRLVASLVLMVFAVTGSELKAETVGVYTEGIYSFTYSASNGYGDDFSAEGTEFLASGTFGASQMVACGGFFDQSTSDPIITTLTLYAANRNPDDTVDAAVLWVTNNGDGVPVGDYPITFGQTENMFVFVDNIEAFEPPADWTDTASLIAWASNLTALHIFTATSGTIQITDCSVNAADGAFTGKMVDALNPLLFPQLTVSSGLFDYEGTSVPDAATSFGHVKALFR